MSHGVAFEPVVNEAYQLLTGNTTCESGFWVPLEDNILYNLVGASPDAKVYANVQGTRICIGLAEYKAPVYQMYQEKATVPHAIPRMYMAQMQGQLAVSGQPWCDFMAVCKSSQDILLKRVYFNTTYWNVVSTKLRHFFQTLQKAKTRKLQNLDPLDFDAAIELKSVPACLEVMPEECLIEVQNLLECDTAGRYRSLADTWMTFDFLIGNSQ
ncbi:hypothetical protein LSAT2_007497 [Lamellibrachia satsuma]|nr:hypothetical protein LSAT2_007497 [Lamellibrachia satsuma]